MNQGRVAANMSPTLIQYINALDDQRIEAGRKKHLDEIIQSLNSAKNVNLIEAPELVVEELRSGIYEIGRLTGTVDVEEYLEVIFKEFCIGK